VRHLLPVPPRAVVPDALRRKAFRGSTVVRSGLLTANQLRGPAWRRLFPDVYAHVELPVTHELRALVAARLVVPGSVVTGRSAAGFWGVELAGAADDVELTVPPGRHPVRTAGVRVRRSLLDPALVTRRGATPVTTAEATAVRLAGILPGDEGVVAVDRLVATGIVDLQAIRLLAAATTGPGSARARTACALADGLAESPPETRLRLLIGRSSLPTPVAQFRVVHEGRIVARPDFAWPDRKVALEYDGLWHAQNGQFAKDRDRLNRLREAGWQVVFVTAADMNRPEEVLRRIASALSVAVVVRG
jgi:G:T-mismatch repair DNA endonuclease (very short patch repair protein)